MKRWSMSFQNPFNLSHYMWLYCEANTKSEARSIFKKKLKRRLNRNDFIQNNSFYDPPHALYVEEVEDILRRSHELSTR